MISRERMVHPEIMHKVLLLARNVFEEDELAFDERTPFEQIEEWDSANHVHMVVAMEKAFGIRFELAELQRLSVVGDLAAVIARKRMQAG
jgi:acyl carrier protein